MLSYPVNLEAAEEGGFVVSFPDLPEAHTQGEDRDEALLQAADALETALSFYVEDGRDLPRASAPQGGQPVVSPSALGGMKLAVYHAMRQQGVRKAELARRLNWRLPQVERMLDLNQGVKFERLETALAALGKAVDIKVRNATEQAA